MKMSSPDYGPRIGSLTCCLDYEMSIHLMHQLFKKTKKLKKDGDTQWTVDEDIVNYNKILLK